LSYTSPVADNQSKRVTPSPKQNSIQSMRDVSKENMAPNENINISLMNSYNKNDNNLGNCTGNLSNKLLGDKCSTRTFQSLSGMEPTNKVFRKAVYAQKEVSEQLNANQTGRIFDDYSQKTISGTMSTRRETVRDRSKSPRPPANFKPDQCTRFSTKLRTVGQNLFTHSDEIIYLSVVLSTTMTIIDSDEEDKYADKYGEVASLIANFLAEGAEQLELALEAVRKLSNIIGLPGCS